MNERLERAVKANDAAAARRALENVEDILEREERGYTPLLLAATVPDSTEVAKVLVEAGDDMDARDLDEAGTPLMYGAQRSFSFFVSYLISAGADITLRDNSGKDALMVAAFWADKATIAPLLAAGADPNRKEGNGWTSLTLAVRGNNTATMESLLESGADISVLDRVGGTLMHHAAWFGKKDALSLLIEKGLDVNAKDSLGWTPLMKAMDASSPECVEILLSSGADPEAVNNEGMNALGIGKKAKAVEAISVYMGKRGGVVRYTEDDLRAKETEWTETFGREIADLKAQKKIKGNLDKYYLGFFTGKGAVGGKTEDGKFVFRYDEDNLNVEVTYNTEDNTPGTIRLWY